MIQQIYICLYLKFLKVSRIKTKIDQLNLPKQKLQCQYGDTRMATSCFAELNISMVNRYMTAKVETKCCDKLRCPVFI